MPTLFDNLPDESANPKPQKKLETPPKEIPKKKLNRLSVEDIRKDIAAQKSKHANYLSELNNIQRQAVERVEGPVMIIAGPGSGKTRVLTYRIAHLINQDILPWNILALTFTNKAAREMKERIEKIVGETAARNLYMGTFHSVFARILRVEADKLGYPNNFTIYDTQDAKSLVSNIVKELNLNPDLYKTNLVYNRISNAKNALVTPKAYLKNGNVLQKDKEEKRPKMGQIYSIYWQRCMQAGAMDFDDLLVRMYQLLQQFPEVAQKYQERFRYIMIDEFQDTNTVQYAIVKKLGAAHKNICVVGDDAQSIYAFRGATIDNILNFEKDYKNLQTFKLEQNYRSTKNIVKVANDIIRRNSKQLKKSIWTDKPEGNKIKWIKAATDSDEGRLVAESIFVERLRNHYQNKEFAILYRTNAQSRIMEEALRRKGIPYRVYGGLSFYQRKEIKDLMGYLRLTVNHKDEEALRRVINYPSRGIGKTTMEKISKAAVLQQMSLWEVMSGIGGLKIAGRTQKAVSGFAKMINWFDNQATKMNAYELAKKIADKSGLLTNLHTDKTVEGISRYENIQELLNSIKEFVDNKADGIVNEVSDDTDDSLGAYLQEVSLLTNMDNEEEDDNKVSLMTIHSAKGLEFKCVYIVGLEEDLFPSKMSSNSTSELEEERRLFYVAATRAEEKLILSNANCRYRFGKLVYCDTSRFISEINPFLLQPEGGFRSSRPNKSGDSKGYSSFKDSIKNNVKSAKQKHQKNLTPVAPIKSFKASPAAQIAEGQVVYHQRFGKGTVLSTEGRGDKKVAILNFEHAGEKRIMLRFAKLMILEG